MRPFLFLSGTSLMADLYNRKPILGAHVVDDGETMHNGAPVFGVYSVDESVKFEDSQYVLGVDVLCGDETMHNMQTVRGVVMIDDGRRMYNNRRVVPAYISGKPPSENAIITAGANPDPQEKHTGYSDGTLGIPAFGSINGNPVEDHPALVVTTTPLAGDEFVLQVIIEGDVLSNVAGTTVWIDGIGYTPMSPDLDWQYIEGVNGTMWVGVIPQQFKVGSQYVLEIKEPAQ